MQPCAKCKKEIKKGAYFHKLMPTAYIMCDKCYNDSGHEWIMNFALIKHVNEIIIKRDRND